MCDDDSIQNEQPVEGDCWSKDGVWFALIKGMVIRLPHPPPDYMTHPHFKMAEDR